MADEDKRKRSKLLIAEIDSMNPKPTVVLSAVAVAELLTRQSAETREHLATTIGNDFVVAPFDLRAARLSAELFDKHSGLIKSEVPYDKRIVRTDTMIIASVFCAGVTTVYSDDKRFRTIAEGHMDARALPTHSENLYVDHESAKDRSGHS